MIPAMTDERLNLLSPNARDLLSRILEAFPHETLFGSGVPAAPAQLRLTLYHSDDPRLDSQIGRQLKELELNSIGILRRVSRKTRYLKLTLDFAAGPQARDEAMKRLSVTPANALTLQPFNPSTNAEGALIHNSAGLSPPVLQKIAVVAATASSVLEFCISAREFCPEWLDLPREWNDYVAHRRKKDRPSTLENFVATWLPRAQRRFGRLAECDLHRHLVSDIKTLSHDAKVKVREIRERQQQQPDHDEHPDLFEHASTRRFMAQYEERKAARCSPD